MKSVLIVGLGQVGTYLVQALAPMGLEVVAVDNCEERVNAVLEDVTAAQIGDTTHETFLQVLGVEDFDVCVVTIGEDFESSVVTTALLKDHGARRVIAKASSPLHAKFLLRNGADEVFYPERDMANRVAARISTDSLRDYIHLSSGYSLFDIATPKAWEGKTIAQAQVRRKYNVNIIGYRENGVLHPNPQPEYVFNKAHDLLVVAPDKEARRLLD